MTVRDSKYRPRIAEAVAFAPWSVGVPLFAFAFFTDHGAALLIVGLYAVMIAYVGMLFVGIPVILLFSRYGMTEWWQVMFAGVPVPVVLTGLNPSAAITFGSCGAFVALVAWFIAFFRLRAKDEELIEATQ